MISLRRKKKIPTCMSLLKKLLVKYCHSGSLPSGFLLGSAIRDIIRESERNQGMWEHLRGSERDEKEVAIVPSSLTATSQKGCVLLSHPQLLVRDFASMVIRIRTLFHHFPFQEGKLMITRSPLALDGSHNSP